MVDGFYRRDVQAAKAEAESRLRQARVTSVPHFDIEELTRLIRGLGDMAGVLGEADPARKARIYESLGLRLTFHPAERKVLVSRAPPRGAIGGRPVCVRGGT